MRAVARLLVTLACVLGVAGCSVLSVDLTPRVRPLEEETVEGRGDAKIVLIELAGLLSDAETGPILSVGNETWSRMVLM